VTVDTIVSEYLELHLRFEPGSMQAHSAVRSWLQERLDENNDPGRFRMSQWLLGQAVKAVARRRHSSMRTANGWIRNICGWLRRRAIIRSAAFVELDAPAVEFYLVQPHVLRGRSGTQGGRAGDDERGRVTHVRDVERGVKCGGCESPAIVSGILRFILVGWSTLCDAALLKCHR
jgi:hypothetical protein